jgi:riboflavin synthase
MFTGIIEELGAVRQVRPLQDGSELTIGASWSAELKVGDSVAVNGACLTVIDHDDESFRVQAGFETLRRTNIGRLRPNDRVNLERALRVGDRLGGHFVSGHVDTTAVIVSRESRGEFESFWFHLPSEWTRQMVPKGSVAVDGISLTLVDVTSDRFSVMLIPHTLAVTTLGLKAPHDIVNIETDLLAKYVQRQLNAQDTP